MNKVSAFISNFLRIDYLSRRRAVVDKEFFDFTQLICCVSVFHPLFFSGVQVLETNTAWLERPIRLDNCVPSS
jgi:hypothetical protein